jgi:hypothetical protein
MAITLYQIAAEHRALADKLAELELDDATILDTLEGERLPLEQKARAVAIVARNLRAEAEAYNAHAKEAAQRGKALDKRAASLEAYLMAAMQSTGISEIKGEAMCIKVKANPPSVSVYQPELIPQEFMRQPETPPPEPDKKAIAAALKDGQDVPGAMLVQGHRLEIK